MDTLQGNALWLRTLGHEASDKHKEEREFLRAEYLRFREKAKLLADEIAGVLPEFTIHDISHIDALWDIASLFLAEDYTINPAEAFVLGGAFLVHDLGMALAAYPRGMDEIKEKPIWRDTVSRLQKNQKNETNPANILTPEAIEKKATELTLRVLHGERASDLASISWKDAGGRDIFLIDNAELRNAYSRIIGIIAHSHCTDIDQICDRCPASLGALPRLPTEWTVDTRKLACILRLSDAIQIDDRRAPHFLQTIRKPQGESARHWTFQSKLYKPNIDKNRVVYTSKSSFSIKQIDAWWLCYDTLVQIDKEIKQVDSFLSSRNIRTFDLTGVAGAGDAAKLSQLVTVEGWEPVDTQIRVSDVATLARTLGGEQLYGKNVLVPLREAIQNASDAIRARKYIDTDAGYKGKIQVRIDKDETSPFIEIEDNGVGMSPKVLLGPFLDFGNSFWGTEMMHNELPGLECTPFAPTGKYGIGFFSYFMWGSKVQVTTRRYELGRGETKVLEFNGGLSSRAILRSATPSEQLGNGGTRIRIWAGNETIENIFKQSDYWGMKRREYVLTLRELIENLCPSLDCDVDTVENGKCAKAIRAEDWKKISSRELLRRIAGRRQLKELTEKSQTGVRCIIDNMEFIKSDDGEIVGRAALYDEPYMNFPVKGVVTVGGLRTSSVSGLIGIFPGESERASRDQSIPVVAPHTLEAWNDSQMAKLSAQAIDTRLQLRISSIAKACGMSTGDLKIALHQTGHLNLREITDLVSAQNFSEYILVQDAAVDNYERDLSCQIQLYDNVFVCDMGIPTILHTNPHFIWPEREKSSNLRFYNYTLEGLVIQAIASVWGVEPERLFSQSNYRSQGDIGEANGSIVHMAGLRIIANP